MLWMRKDSAETSRLASLHCCTIVEPPTILNDAEELRNARVINDHLVLCPAGNATQSNQCLRSRWL